MLAERDGQIICSFDKCDVVVPGTGSSPVVKGGRILHLPHNFWLKKGVGG